jgi:hypothetical protein
MKKVAMLLLAFASVCFFTTAYISVRGKTNTTYATIQDNPPSAVKKARRDAKYSEPGRQRIIGNPNGSTRHFFVDAPLSPTGDFAAVVAKASSVRKQVLCSSETVVRGIVTSATGYVTSDETSLYTVYKVKISDRLRGEVASDEIEVTGPGGFITVNGKQYAYKHFLFPLRPQGEYVLFLSYDKVSGDYELIQNEGVYDVMPDSTITRSDARQPGQAQQIAAIGVPTNFDILATEVKSTVCK